MWKNGVPKYVKARHLRKQGYSYSEIGKKLHVSSGTAWRYCNLPQTVPEGRDRTCEYKLNKAARKRRKKQ